MILYSVDVRKCWTILIFWLAKIDADTAEQEQHSAKYLSILFVKFWIASCRSSPIPPEGHVDEEVGRTGKGRVEDTEKNRFEVLESEMKFIIPGPADRNNKEIVAYYKADYPKALELPALQPLLR